ncbi:MAG: hypothetical protein ACRDY1_03665, partial [Acidimicrobiales bacterium]
LDPAVDAASSPTAIAVDPTSGDVSVADDRIGNANKGDVSVLPLFLDVDDPAAQPEVTGVGGTDLTNVDGPVESVWNAPLNDSVTLPEGAGGGGISSVFALPAYQAGIVGTSSNGACGAPAGSGCREVPDVAASADPSNGYVIYYDGSWTAFGGTSGAAPLWAAVAALAVALNGTPQPLGNLNPDLYALAAAGQPDFNDVTTGDNDFTDTAGGTYAAGPGYDMASGLGSPQGTNLATDLNPFAITTQPASQLVAAGQDVTLSVGYSVAASTPPSVQWEVSSDGGTTFSPITGATGDAYEFTADGSENNDRYEAVISSTVRSLTSAVATLQVVSITTMTLPTATRGQHYRVQLTAVGGLTPYVWSHTGALPKGLRLTGRGLLVGKPKTKHQAAGTYNLTIDLTTHKTTKQPNLTTSVVLPLTLQ